MRSGLRKGIKIFLFNLVAVAGLFLLLEGAASTLRVVRDISLNQPVAERRHTRHDEELGWVNEPMVYIEDMYGPGIYLQTNAQGFRNQKAFSTEVPEGKTRMICSGDSYTLGYGVDNDHTWCQLLSSIDARLETVNMGQGGYGVDQAYLWYRRDGTQLDHDVQILAFITPDFDRMQQDRFMGYGKPFLVLEEGQLRIKNFPVPHTSSIERWLANNRHSLAELNVVLLGRWLMERDATSTSEAHKDYPADEARIVVAQIFDDLVQLNEEKESHLVLVYLPTPWDYDIGEQTRRWKSIVQEEALKRDVPFIDLVEDMRRLPNGAFDSLYGDHAHFTAAGNRYVAKRIYEHLTALSIWEDEP